MPIPRPKENEKPDEFLHRCMSDKTMISEFPDQKQRAAVCMTYYKRFVEDRNKLKEESRKNEYF